MSGFRWYADRLRAMGPLEVAHHARKRWRGLVDTWRVPTWSRLPLASTDRYPRLPPASAAPPVVREALRRDADAILAGRWRVFGDLELRVDDPPRWQTDYLAGQDLRTGASAFALNYRLLPRGADIKLVWELSRWWHLVRLAMAAYVLEDATAARTCLRWLQDWARSNPPYRGWNWTSALEGGIRLIQITWIDALLATTDPAGSGVGPELGRVWQQLLPAHLAYVWRHRSFGSSANNHLFGELVGLILATVRWPDLAPCAAPLDELQAAWEREVARQFASDGGNREQALHYHLFSWELCWHARAALKAADRPVAPSTEDRLRRAAQFYVDLHGGDEPWDFGDSDDAVVTPCAQDVSRSAQEWHHWLVAPARSATLQFWLGAAPVHAGVESIALTHSTGEWRLYHASGYAVWRDRRWTLRWDASPLGYLSTAAHGHLDALHLSLWVDGVAMVVDPGTGCYFADPDLRAWLASASAHNGPDPVRADCRPRRRGPFLWAPHHPRPALEGLGRTCCRATLACVPGVLERTVEPAPAGAGWVVQDRSTGLPDGFTVRWQFAPGAVLHQVAEREFKLSRAGASLEIHVGAGWHEARPEPHPRPSTEEGRAGTTAPTFRHTAWAPSLTLAAGGGVESALCSTSFSLQEPR
jgi:hypothetical protein